MDRTVYWVSPHDDGWQVKREGAERASEVFATKRPAIDRGAELAQADMPSQLKIQREDGTIEGERTYGDDPHPPAG